MLMHAVGHGGCTDTVRESALKVGSGKKKKHPLPHLGLETASALRLALQWDALPTELSPFFSKKQDQHSIQVYCQVSIH